MPQRLEQFQAFCNQCQRPTLHQRTRTQTNHVLHLLVTLFCCGLWIPVWVLIAIVNSLERTPFLCTQCGQSAGQPTPEQQAAMMQQSAIRRQRIAEQTARARAEGRERRAYVYADVRRSFDDLVARLRSGTAATIEELKRLPGRTDHVLRIIAGEGNDIVLWFLRIATIVCMVGITAGIMIVVCGTFSAIDESASQAETERGPGLAHAVDPAPPDLPKPKGPGNKNHKPSGLAGPPPVTELGPEVESEPDTVAPKQSAAKEKPPAGGRTPAELGALFAGVRKVSLDLTSADGNANSKINLMLRDEAQTSVERIGATPTTAEDAAVLRLNLEANPGRQFVRLVLSGELACRVSNSEEVVVWKHERQIADVAPALLLRPTVHPTIRKGVDEFFSDFVAAHQKAREEVNASKSTPIDSAAKEKR